MADAGAGGGDAGAGGGAGGGAGSGAGGGAAPRARPSSGRSRPSSARPKGAAARAALSPEELTEFREIFNLVDKVRCPSCGLASAWRGGANDSVCGGWVRTGVTRLPRSLLPRWCSQDGGGTISKEELAELMETLGINASQVGNGGCGVGGAWWLVVGDAPWRLVVAGGDRSYDP